MLCDYTRYATRSVDSVCTEINSVVEKIYGINEMLNIREVIAEVLSLSKEDMAASASRLAELYKHSSELSLEMSELFLTLETLRAELCEILADDGIIFGGRE